MISIECHRSGERCPGKREFDNRIEINRVRSGEIMWLFPLMTICVRDVLSIKFIIRLDINGMGLQRCEEPNDASRILSIYDQREKQASYNVMGIYRRVY